MWFTCKICNFTHSCWCGWKKCKCWMNLWQARVADSTLRKYPIEDKAKLVELIKWWNSLSQILNEFWLDSKEDIINNNVWKQVSLDKKFARRLWMNSIYCEYDSFNENAECKFCGRKRKDWYLQPCLYYLANKWQTE